MRERILLSESEERVLRTFRRFLMTPGQMLCFSGPSLKQDKAILELLTDKELLVKEKFKGGYSLTQAGFAAMNDCELRADATS
jgi:hypothetical protein